MSTVINGDSNVNLDFSTGGRITGDFSNATIANRAMFQTSTANGATSVSAIPNGTNTQADLFAFNAADPTNAGLGLFRASATEVTLRSAITGTGSYIPMTFYTGGSERMRVDTSGNVGIGTSSPLATAMLEVSRSTTVIPTATVTADAQVVGWRSRRTGGSFPREYYIGIRENSTALDFYDNTADALRARIDSSGNLLVGTTSAGVANTLSTTIETSGANNSRITVNHSSAAGSSNDSNYMQFGYGGNLIGRIVQASTTTVSYTTSSDYRLKNTVAPMTGALAKVALLKPCTYKWNADGSDGQGFIAHELQAVIPDAVAGEKDAVNEDGSIKPQGIDTSFLVATLTAALQEAHGLIKDQATAITALTARVEALEGTQP